MKNICDKLKDNRIVLLRILWVIGLVILILLISNFRKYKQAKLYYNKGVKRFNEYAYSDAETYFQSALWEKHTKRQECKIRINEALSIVTPISPDSITADNIDENIERLEYARSILVENDCTHESDSNGHNKKAQKLKDEIDEYIEELKKMEQEQKQEENNQGTSEEEQKKLEEEEREFKEKQAELKETFGQIEQEGLKERNSNLEMFEQWGKSIFSSGKSW